MALEVSAAIIGILAAAGKVAETLGPIVHSFAEAPKHARAIHTEVRHSRTILLGLQALFGELAVVSSRRKQLIQIDQLVAALTDGVLLFSELETLLGGMGDPAGALLHRLKWARKANDLDAIVQRLYGFKTSIALMLNILRCESDLEAHADRRKLLMNTSQVLASNLDLAQRLANLEGHVAGPQSVTTTRPISHATASIWATDTIRSDVHTLQPWRPGDTTWSFPFEIELRTSRVYQRVRRESTDFSFCSSAPRSHAWTALSDISLSDISAVSVIALPLYSNDITNAYRYGFTHLGDDRVNTHPEALAHKNGHPRRLQPEYLQIRPPSPSLAPSLDTESAESKPTQLKIFFYGNMDGLVSRFPAVTQLRTKPGLQYSNFYTAAYSVDDVQLNLDIEVVDDDGVRLGLGSNADCFVLGDLTICAYSTSSPQSFAMVQRLIQRLIRHGLYDNTRTVMIVANNSNTGREQKVVYSEGQDLASDIDCAFCEATEIDMQSFHAAFSDLVRNRWALELNHPIRHTGTPVRVQALDFNARSEHGTPDSSDTSVYSPIESRVPDREDSLKSVRVRSSVSSRRLRRLSMSDYNTEYWNDFMGVGASIERGVGNRHGESNEGNVLYSDIRLPSPAIPQGY